MTKKELFAEVGNICEKHGIEGEAKDSLLALVEPKRGGGKVDIDEIAVRDTDGTALYILDSVLKVWVPVLNEEGEPNFYEKEDTELGWSRFSRAAEKARKDAEKTFKATKDGILNDLLEGEIDQEDAKELMESAEAARKTYELPEDFVSYEDRPAA